MSDYIINFYKDGKLQYNEFIHDYYDNVENFAMIKCEALGSGYTYCIMLD